MILNTSPVNEATVSNVGEIGEFRIRNSAKAFSILSSGLYANKIRAILRELSCNALDSHTAAGRADQPFDIHLPTALEPHFAIRDYGTGLSHDQVCNIYTTYFESTKTESNEFVGALGLGSKSPFSYTDNFTVTAIQNGRKGIYTAFINNLGVPNIALMMQEDTVEPDGVEVRFAIEDRQDYEKFRIEAREVYTYFPVKPKVNVELTFTQPTYESTDLIPGVHVYQKSYYTRPSVAVMGNIAYPIDIPQADKSLGNLKDMLSCGLEIHFAIGELDFQASREGLSYVPQTILAIKRKLEHLNNELSVIIAREADAIENLWSRATFLSRKYGHRLWTEAVKTYAQQAKLPTYDHANTYGARPTTFHISVDDLANNWNIRLHQFRRANHCKTISTGTPTLEYPQGHPKNSQGNYIAYNVWHIPVDSDSHFVINDLKTGAQNRTTYHYRETPCIVHHQIIWLLDKADKTKDMDIDGFFAAIYEPPTASRFKASDLLKPQVEKKTKNISILFLEKRRILARSRDHEMVWTDAGDISNLSSKDSQGDTIYYYYVPLNGFVMESSKGYSSGKSLYEEVTSLPGLYSGKIYGVRKKDIEDIKQRKNWKNFEDHIESCLNKYDTNDLLVKLAKRQLQHDELLNFRSDEILPLVNDRSPYKNCVLALKSVDTISYNCNNVISLFKKFRPNLRLDVSAAVEKYQNMLNDINQRYPLMRGLSIYRSESADIAEYINLIDSKKGYQNESV